jgi:hypothetical protein
MAYKIYLTRKFSRGWRIFTNSRMARVLQSKELKLVQRLHILNAWEERAEDPFRGLRAGPASFSPFSFSANAIILPVFSDPSHTLGRAKRSTAAHTLANENRTVKEKFEMARLGSNQRRSR